MRIVKIDSCINRNCINTLSTIYNYNLHFCLLYCKSINVRGMHEAQTSTTDQRLVFGATFIQQTMTAQTQGDGRTLHPLRRPYRYFVRFSLPIRSREVK